MAMRPRTIGGARNAAANNQRATAAQPVYEDFKPKSEWIQDQESDSLLIHLPGFTKESLKVSTQGSTILRVVGERLVTANKWQKFQQDFPVPDYCNIRGTHARFEGGILTIKVPKKTITPPPPPPKQESKPTQQAPTSSTTPQKPQQIPKDPVSQKVQENIPPKNNAPNKEDKPKAFQESHVPPKPISPLPPKQVELPKTSVEQKQKVDSGASKHQETMKQPKALEGHAMENEKRVPKLLGTEMEGGNKVTKADLVERKIQDSEKFVAQKTELGDGDKGKYPEKRATSSGTGHLGVGNYKKAVKSLANLDEERKLMVNMGAAVLVFMALGAYIYHTVKAKI